jgi:nucleotide-binding universal stress UspA family protein
MRILIALTSTRNNYETLHFSAQLAQRTEIPPTILMVVARETDRFLSPAEKSLKDAREQMDIPELITKIRTGDPIKEIILEVEEGKHDLVIIGEKYTSYWVRWFHRFPAVCVAEQVPCSAIISKGKAKPIRRILLCDSGAGSSSVLSRYTAQLAKILPNEEHVTVLHVMSQISAGPGVSGKYLRASTEELIEENTLEGQILERDVQTLEHLGIHPIPKVRHGLVVNEILTEAQNGDYDLVVVGQHLPSGPQSFLLDNIAHQILKRIDRPILVVRGNEITDSTQ